VAPVAGNPEMSYLLYNAPQSTCSQRVRFTLHAKGIPFEEKKLSLLDGDQLKPDYLKLNPNGVVPTLDHDGKIVIDSTVITEYLDEVAPEKSFTPADPVKRAAMRSQMRFIDEMPAPSVRVPTFNLAFLPRFQKMSRDEFIAFAESKPLRKEMMLAMGQAGFPQKEMDAALDRMNRTYERMDYWIGESGGPWLMGKDLTLSDIALMPALVRMDDLNLSDMWAGRPRVVKWYEMIKAHPAFAPTYYHGTLLTQIFPHLSELAKKRA
jgi:glutathione S-transferase